MAVKKSRFRSRANYAEELQNRTEASSGSRGGKWKSIFSTAQKFEKWSCKEGDHVIDIIPYVNNDDERKYKLELLVHQRVGPDEGSYVCPKTFDSSAKCPLCVARAKVQKMGDEDLAESLRPRDRVAYNVVCYDNTKEEDKGVQVWEASAYLAEDNFKAAAKKRQKGGNNKTVSFADPDDGRTISFERTGQGVKTKYVGFTMDVRDEPISDDILDQAYILEDLLDMADFDTLQSLADIVLSTSEMGEEKDEDEVDSKRVRRKPVRKPAKKEEEDEEDESGTDGEADGGSEDAGNDDDGSGEDSSTDEEPDEEAPRKRRTTTRRRG